MSDIAALLQAVRHRIDQAVTAANRLPGSVQLLAVSKTKPLADVLAAAAAGQVHFGENYVQEGVDKILATASLPLADPLIWHFIGPLQSNKTRLVAEHFAWIHTVDRVRIAERLSAQRPPQLPPLQVCVQVNISGEDSKSGCAPEEAAALCAAVSTLPQLTLRGLMAIPEADDNPEAQRRIFGRMQTIFATIRRQPGIDFATFDTLSMGMTHDLEAAIAEGATLVRVGTGIFGERQYA